MNKYKKLILPGFSLALIGMGLSISIEAGYRKWNGQQSCEWILMGTVGLVIFNAGLSVFGEAIIRASKDRNTKVENQQKN